MIETKKCTKCGLVKPLEDFHKDKRTKRDGRQASCRECVAKQKRAYREANKPAFAERDRAYREANKAAIAERKRAYREANKAAIAERDRAYYEANKDAIAERNRARRMGRAARTDEEIAEEQARLRENGMKQCRKCREILALSKFSAARCNPDGLCHECRHCDAARKARNREANLAILREYWTARGIDPDHCAYCNGPFEHVDHLHPVSVYGLDEPWLMLPSCAPCNLSKSAKLAADWLAALDDPDAWLLDPVALAGATLADGSPVPVSPEVARWAARLATA